MKIVLLSMMCFIVGCQEKKYHHPLEGKNYKLVFEDKFDTNSLDTSKWQTTAFSPKPFDRIPPRSSCDFSNAEIFLDRNITLNGGLLKLGARKENYTYSGITGGPCKQVAGCHFIGCDSFTLDLKYTSASIFSKEGYNHGYFECRAKIPAAKGLYPAFWLWHHDEIVVYEFFGNPKDHFVSLHNKGDYVTEKFNKVGDYSADFHIYSVEWTPYEVTWYFDLQPIRTDYKYLERDSKKGIPASRLSEKKDIIINKTFPDSKDRWLHANLSLGVYEWAAFIDEKALPDYLVIDYVKIYQTQ